MNTAFQMQAAGLGVKHMLIIPRQYSFDGGELDSIGLRVLKWTAQQAMTVNQANSVNAKASTNGGFKFSGRGVKIASARREAVLA